MFGTIALFMMAWSATMGRVQTIYCPNPPPGLDAMSRGVDVTKLDMLPLDTMTDNGYVRRVIEFTCDKGRKWTSPFNEKPTYDLPDQVETINAIPGGVVDASYNVFTDYRYLKTAMSSKAGVGFLKGMFSSSGSYKKAQESITNFSKTVAILEGHFSAVQADFVPFWEYRISGSAKSFIDNQLPNEFTANPELFHQFIGTFGTHVLGSGKLGGVYKLTIDIDNSYSYQKSERDVEVEAKATFFKLLQVNGAYQGSNTQVSEQFQSKSLLTSRYFGGNANLFAADSWNNWWPTVPGNPWLFGGKLEPITNLLEDGPKKEAIKKASQVYLDKAYLEEIQRTLNSFIGKGRAGEDRARQLVSQVIGLLGEVAPNHETVSSLGDQVDDFAILPDWFTRQTQLCFNWYPTLCNRWHMCLVGTSRNLCATTNQMTPFYKDDTDQRKDGCRMQWGIKAAGAPVWFSKVRMCFRWYAEDKGSQCGGGAPAETCSVVGDSTIWYQDDADKRKGGCKMSWRLEVPIDSPGWLLNTRLCFCRFAEDNAGQCGGGIDQNQCAVANQWTEYYREDIDKLKESCQMSWGLKTLN